jgi:hypothetical protein
VSRAGAALPPIDWAQPWMAPLAELGREAERRVRAGARVAEALDAVGAGGPAGVRFVPHAALPPGVAYERFILETGTVPTRDNLHDLLNGLCWWRYAASKLRLNRLHVDEIGRRGVGPARGPVRDALTLVDENGALWQAPEPLWAALRARAWERLFGELRPLWAQARLHLVGHALVEKLVAPYKAITAHVYAEPVPPGLGPDGRAWDRWFAERLRADVLARKPFVPLPVLGVPGWWPANEVPGFYDDAAVFRPAGGVRERTAG